MLQLQLTFVIVQNFYPKCIIIFCNNQVNAGTVNIVLRHQVIYLGNCTCIKPNFCNTKALCKIIHLPVEGIVALNSCSKIEVSLLSGRLKNPIL